MKFIDKSVVTIMVTQEQKDLLDSIANIKFVNNVDSPIYEVNGNEFVIEVVNNEEYEKRQRLMRL